MEAGALKAGCGVSFSDTKSIKDTKITKEEA